MAEIVAIAGLAYLGKILSEPKKEETYTEVSKQAETVPVDPPSVRIDESMLRMPDKKMEVANFGVVAPQSRSNGSEILSMRNRMYDAGRMNNISPVEKQLVGPGLGVVKMLQLLVGINSCYV